MELRSATAADVPAVLPLVRKVADFHESLDPAKFSYLDDVLDRYRPWMIARTTDDRSVFLVAEHERTIVAFIVATIEREIPMFRLETFGFIHDLWVEPTYRNEGLARRLVTMAVERFRELGVKQVRADTAAENTVAAQLLRTCGFRPSTVEMLIELGEPEAT